MSRGGGVVVVGSFNGWVGLGLASGQWRSCVWVMGVVEKERDREERWKGREMSSFIFILLFDG